MICKKKAIQRLIRRYKSGAQGGNPARLDAGISEIVGRLPKTHQDAAKRLVDVNAVKSNDYNNAVVKTSWEGSHPLIVEFYKHFNAALKRRGFPFFAFEFERSFERQAILLKNGVSRAGPGQSPHNWGCAVDVVHLTDYWDIPDKAWRVIGAIGHEVARKRKIPIEWGGDWGADWPRGKRGWDPAHWELSHWEQVRAKWRKAENAQMEITGSPENFRLFEQWIKADKRA